MSPWDREMWGEAAAFLIWHAQGALGNSASSCRNRLPRDDILKLFPGNRPVEETKFSPFDSLFTRRTSNVKSIFVLSPYLRWLVKLSTSSCFNIFHWGDFINFFLNQTRKYISKEKLALTHDIIIGSAREGMCEGSQENVNIFDNFVISFARLEFPKWKLSPSRSSIRACEWTDAENFWSSLQCEPLRVCLNF